MSLKMDYTVEIGDCEMGFNVGTIAKQATGSVVVQYGETVLLCTAVIGKESIEERDFFPLSVSYVEKYFAAGKIPGGFFKREGRQSEREILISRVIDRSIRPLFPKDFKRDIQVICTLLSFSPIDSVEMAAMAGASVACGLAGFPMSSLVAGCKIGKHDSKLVVNPDPQISSDIDVFVSCSKTSIFMVESEAGEVSNADMLEALDFGHKSILPLLDMMERVVSDHGKKKIEFIPKEYSALYDKIAKSGTKAFNKSYGMQNREERSAEFNIVRKQITEELTTEETTARIVKHVLQDVERDIVRQKMFSEKQRIDGRSFEEIRELKLEANILPPRCHGSALFSRGGTQALVVTTLGSSADEQNIDSVIDPRKEHFLLHYNFPPYSVGENEALKGPGRREIGHGNLAYRAIKRMIPAKDEFPYTIRVVSEITESDGSSSMATVCGSTLSLIATGVPLKQPVAGIAMGLIKEKDSFVILTDICADEDHFGDMDFKVARTKNGLTALQMDIKVDGITIQIMKQALEQAADACNIILEKIVEAIPDKVHLGSNVPKVEKMSIPVNKIADLIGKSGATIKSICDATGAKIDIEQSGEIRIFVAGDDKIELTKQMIRDVTTDLKIGDVYSGTVEKILPFGAIVDLPGKKSGMVHIKEIADEHIDDIRDYLIEGQKVSVLVLGFDEKRRLKLSVKRAAEGYVQSDESNSMQHKGRFSHTNDRNDRNRGKERFHQDDNNENNHHGRRDYQEDNRRGGDKSYDDTEGGEEKSSGSFFGFAKSLGRFVDKNGNGDKRSHRNTNNRRS